MVKVFRACSQGWGKVSCQGFAGPLWYLCALWQFLQVIPESIPTTIREEAKMAAQIWLHEILHVNAQWALASGIFSVYTPSLWCLHIRCQMPECVKDLLLDMDLCKSAGRKHFENFVLPILFGNRGIPAHPMWLISGTGPEEVESATSLLQHLGSPLRGKRTCSTNKMGSKSYYQQC